MIADSLTKAHTAGKHNVFIKIVGIESQTDFLISIQKEKDLKDFLQCRTSLIEISESFRYGANATWDVQRYDY